MTALLLLALLAAILFAVVAMLENGRLTRENVALKQDMRHGNFTRHQVAGDWEGVER